MIQKKKKIGRKQLSIATNTIRETSRQCKYVIHCDKIHMCIRSPFLNYCGAK